MEVPTAYYRRLLKDSYPNVRIAFTHSPIVGCVRVPVTRIIEALKKTNDPCADYYIHGLENGTMITIIEATFYSKTWWQPNGELFFKT